MNQTVSFREIGRQARKSGKCTVCGKRRTRTKKFWQTLSPFNKTAEGRIKTTYDIVPELQAKAAEWKKEPINCCQWAIKPGRKKYIMEKKRCEICGKMKKTASTIFNGEYCIECYKTVIEWCKEAIEEIKAGK